MLTLGVFSLDDPRTAVEIARSLRDTLNDSAPAVLESSGNAPTADKRARWAYGLESSVSLRPLRRNIRSGGVAGLVPAAQRSCAPRG